LFRLLSNLVRDPCKIKKENKLYIL